MPTVPSYGDSAYVGPRVATAPLQVSKEQPKDYSTAFGAAEGRALQNVGKQVAQVGDRLGQITTELQIQENEFQVKKAAVALSEGYRIALTGDGTPENPGYSSLNGEEAMKALPVLNARLAEIRKNATENIQGTRAKEMFSEYSAPKEQEAFGVAAAHSLQQGEVAKDAVTLALIKSAESDAAVAGADVTKAARTAATQSMVLARKKTQDPEAIARAGVEGSTLAYKSAITAAIKRRDPVEAERLLGLGMADGMMDGQVSVDLAESIVVAREQAKARQNAALAQAREERSLSLLNEAVDLRVAAAQGQDVAQEALAFRQRYAQDKQGALQFLAIMNAGNEQQKRIAKEQAQLLRGQAAINQEIVLDPYNTDDKNVADATYGAMRKSWADKQVPPEQQVAKTIGFVNQTGIIPEEVKQAVRGGLNSLNPDAVVSAAGLLGGLVATNPVFAQQFSPAQISVGTDVLDYLSSGATPEEAVNLMREARRVPEAQKTARSAEFTALAKEQPPADYLETKYPEGWFSSAPTASSTMKTEFERLAKEEYIKTGKLDSAYSAAATILDQAWGVSAVSGTAQMMKHSPEKVYGIGNLSPEENSAWIREQFISDFTKNAMYPPGAENTLTVTVHPFARDPRTGQPLYSMIFLNEANQLETVMESPGVPLAWQPNFSNSPAAARAAAVRQAEQEAARALDQQLIDPVARDKTQKALNPLIVGAP